MEKYINNNNIIEYIERGDLSSASAIVFIHGLGASSGQFEAISLAISKNHPELRIVLVDLPGHGNNLVSPDGDVGFDSFASLILALTDKLNISSALFVGISMGSELSLLCAKLRPSLVSGVLAIRPAWFIDKAPANLDIIDRVGSWLSQHEQAEAERRLELDDEYQKIKAETPEAAASVLGAILRSHSTAHAHVLKTVFADRPFKSSAELAKVKAPVKVLGNYSDPLHPIATAQLVAGAIPDARFDIIPPKYLEREAHDVAVTQNIESFLKNNWR